MGLDSTVKKLPDGQITGGKLGVLQSKTGRRSSGSIFPKRPMIKQDPFLKLNLMVKAGA